MNILVTGGAGFIGSHLIDGLIKETDKVVCIDDLSLGREENIAHLKANPRFTFIKENILRREKIDGIFKKYKFNCVFHLAADSDIQKGAENLHVDLERTFMTTFNILERMKENNVKQIIFASSSAIYGELSKKLNEDTGPLFPISFYGAAKLASEAYISAFSTNCDIQAWIFRFPNVAGERATHGAMYDFIEKLIANPRELVILGDGRQEKPYLYVKDLVEGMIFAWKNSNEKINYFNLGVDSATTATKIAEIVAEKMGLEGVKFKYTGGERGWIGDVPRFNYDLSKIHGLGWKVKITSDKAVELAVDAELKKRGIK